MAPVIDVIDRLHALYQANSDATNDQLPPLVEPLPPAIVETLATRHFVAEQFPRPLQHALLWDAGFATMADGTLVPIRTHCGVPLTEALSLSSVMLPTCAIDLPTPVSSDIVWLAWSEIAVVPTLVISPTAQLGSAGLSTFVPCRVLRDEADAMFCRPPKSLVVQSWLEAYASVQRGRVLSSSDAGDSTRSQSAPTLDLRADFTTALYALRAAGASLPRVDLSSSVPLDVKARLEVSRLTFSGLSGLLQRAILWDTGYVIQPKATSSKVDVIPIYVQCGLRMADIAPDRAYIESIGCAVQDCSAATGNAMFSLQTRDCQGSSAGTKLSGVSRCAVSATIDSLDVSVAAIKTVWSVGNISTSNRYVVPNLRLLRHPSFASTNSVYFIHSAAADTSSIGTCATTPSFVIPCVTVDQPSREWCRPVQSDLILTWLRQEQHEGMGLATLVLMAGAILIALALDLFVDRKPRIFVNGRVSASMPSITSTLLDGGEANEQNPSQALSDRGVSSVRSAEPVH